MSEWKSGCLYVCMISQQTVPFKREGWKERMEGKRKRRERAYAMYSTMIDRSAPILLHFYFNLLYLTTISSGKEGKRNGR